MGIAGSGKTWRVLDEAAQASLAQPLGAPLLIVVPEQQGVQMERAALARIAELSGRGAAASARIRVMSLSRLAAVLAAGAGHEQRRLAGLQRQLLVWRLLGEEPLAGIVRERERSAKAQLYADLLAELALWDTGPTDLERRAAELELLAQNAGSAEAAAERERCAAKLRELAVVQRSYIAACDERGLEFRPAAALIPELLNEHNWPGLGQTEIWIDGFAGFTPAEEGALEALLARSARLSATLLLDPARLSGPLPQDLEDSYALPRETHARWLELARRCGAQLEDQPPLTAPQRWPGSSSLAALALGGAAATEQQQAGAAARALVCANESAEIEAAAAEIRRLCLPGELGGAGLRFGQISVVTRNLSGYVPLISSAFHDYRIPFFLDQRRSLAQHPAVELLRCGLRLALKQAGPDDVATLLRSGLLCGLQEAEGQRAGDYLLAYARLHNLRPRQWLARQWRLQRRLLAGEEAVDDPRLAARRDQLARLNAWLDALLAPLRELAAAPDLQGETLQMGPVLAAAWRSLITEPLAQRLECWAVAAEQRRTAPLRLEQDYSPDLAELHRGALAALAGLIDALADTAGTAALAPAELLAWLEAGLGQLDLGFPPPALDRVLVTQIDRGRHHSVAATLLLGLAEGQWPPAAQEAALFSDRERALINGAPGQAQTLPSARALLAGGGIEQAQREPYFMLVAATRPAQWLHFSRPALSADGRERPASPFFNRLLRQLGIAASSDASLDPLALPAHPGLLPPGRLLACLAREPELVIPPALLEVLSRRAPEALAAFDWARRQRLQKGVNQPLSQATAAALWERGGRLRLQGSASQLETFALCPFRHLSRYLLRLDDEQSLSFDARTLGTFYHQLFEGLVLRLRETAPAGLATVSEEQLEQACHAVVSELTARLREETDSQRVEYLGLRAEVLMRLHGRQLITLSQETGRQPLATELPFGRLADSGLPPLRIGLGEGELELSGKIDRVDLDPAGQASVLDYKLGQRDFKDPWLLAGAQVQMYVYLLALASATPQELRHALQQRLPGIDGPEAIHPAAAIYQRIEPGWKEDELELSEKASQIAGDPAGEYEESGRADRRPKLRPGLELVRKLLAGQAARILGGELTVSPLRDKQWTACSNCGFRAVCRFDPLSDGRYRQVRTEAELRLKDTGLTPPTVAKAARSGGRGRGGTK